MNEQLSRMKATIEARVKAEPGNAGAWREPQVIRATWVLAVMAVIVAVMTMPSIQRKLLIV